MEEDKIIAKAIIRKGEQDALGALRRIESAERLKKIMNTAEQKHRPMWIRRQVWILASTAAIVAVVLIVGLQPQYSNEELYARWSERVVYEPAVSRGEDQSQIAFEAALALVSEGKTTEASVALEAIAANPSGEYIEDAQWYLAMNYLKTGERDRAKKLLKTIVGRQGDYCDKAKELLKNMAQRRWF